MIELLADKATQNSIQMRKFINLLKTNASVTVDAGDWDMLCTCIIAVISHEATHSHFDAEQQTHVFTRF